MFLPSFIPAMLALIGAHAASTPQIRVVDGDTVRAWGQSWRLTGFDTPEINRAKCRGERTRGMAARNRLRTLVRTARTRTLIIERCSCRPGSHGTFRCNFGRGCASLLVDGINVRTILLREGLAAPYAYNWRNPPRRRNWCR